MEKEIVESIVKALVDKPDSVSIEVIDCPPITLLQVKVDPYDIGNVIGQSGRTSRAINMILEAISLKTGKKTQVEVLE